MVALGHTGSLLRHSEQEVLFPGGSQVMVKELLKALSLLKGAVNSPEPKKPQRGGPVAQLKNRKASRLSGEPWSARCTASTPPHNRKSVTGQGEVSSCGWFLGVGSAVVVDQ